jgi:oxygen-independent coproporphyrinogen-3 oxidase
MTGFMWDNTHMKPVNLYFHIPFCKKRCSYCAFYTVKWHEHLEADYMKALSKELVGLTKKLSAYEVATVYFGGGTPSLINPVYLEKILTQVKALSHSETMEITLEANPDSLTMERLQAYRKLGITRLSMGLQAWQDELLTYFGRLHDRETFVKAYTLARTAGFGNISVDLIFGIPNQTMEQWKESVENVVALAPEHISCYSLELANSSTLGTLHRLGKLKSADEDLDRAMYAYAKKTLGEHGYTHYEISNFAKPGFESRHNSDFWEQKPFYGLGSGASSYFEGVHFHHPESVPLYMKNPKVIEVERMENPQTKKLDFVMLALRRVEGFEESVYTDLFGSTFSEDFSHQLAELKPYHLLTVQSGNVRLTSKGLDLYNFVTRTLSS